MEDNFASKFEKDMKTKVIALGDSLTKGVVFTEDNRYSLLDGSYMNIISDELDLYVENFGKFGSTVSAADSMIDKHSDSISSSDYTFLEYGGNDCNFDWAKIAQTPDSAHSPKTALESFVSRFHSLIDKVKELGSKPVIVSLPPILPQKYFDFFTSRMDPQQKSNVLEWLGGSVDIIARWHESYNRALFMIAKQKQIDIIDITTPFDIYRGDLATLYCSDGIHPNAAGHKFIADSIVNAHL